MMCATVFLQTSPFLMALPIAALIGIVIAAIAMVLVVRSYSMKHKPVEYPLDQFTKLDLREQKDIFLGSHVTKRVIDRDRK